MEDKKLFVTWDEYLALCGKLVHQLKGTDFTDIIAIARGGLIISQILAYQLNIKRIHNYGVNSYSEDNKQTNLLNVYQTTNMKFDNSHRLLIVDDIADSGKTLLECFDNTAFANAERVKIATMHYKPEKSIMRPDYYAQAIDKLAWIVYPYD